MTKKYENLYEYLSDLEHCQKNIDKQIRKPYMKSLAGKNIILQDNKGE